jgi:hypothetical protein
MLPFALNSEQLDDLVPQLCAAIEHYFDTSRIHRLPDRIAFFLRPDCGMAYVNLFGPKLSREIGSIALPYIETLYYALPASDEGGDFENKHADLMQSMRDCIRRALVGSQLRSTLIAILTLHSLALTTIDYDDMETELPIKLSA